MLAGLPVRVAILTGRDKGRVREATLMGLAAGEIDILIGTHAIFQEAVTYRDLGLVVVDEQHRFGVAQRMMLQAKARAPAASAGDDRDADPAHADAGAAMARWTSAGSTRCRRGASRSRRG